MSKRRIFKKTAVVLLCILMYAAGTAGILALTLHHSLNNGASAAIKGVDNDYCNKMYEAVYAALERKMALVVIDTEDLAPYLTEELIADETRLATATVAEELFGGEPVEWRFENSDMLLHIEKLLGEYAAEAGIEYEDGSAEQVYEMICDTVTSELRIVPEEYTDKISTVIVKAEKLLSLWPIPIIIYALAVAAVLFLSKRHLRSGLYNVFLPSYLAMFTLFAGSSILYAKDYLGHTVLGGSMLQAFLQRMSGEILLGVRNVSLALGVAFLMSGLSLAAVIAVRRSHRRKSKSKTE